jgi:peptidoglycan hydrolase-like protein with peptidoglycan-binding domain
MGLKKYEIVSSSRDTIVLQKAASPIKKAWFIPDENTDFEKLCLLRMEFTSPPKGPVTIALWARYKGTEYDLDHKREIKVTGTVSEEHLSLYYVDKHQANIVNNGEKDAKAYYYAKITANGAVCKSEYLEMPIAGIVYKKGDYDDTAATDAKHPKNGDNYKAGKGITVLQRMLISSKFLDITSPTGSYGPKTEEAVKAFQTSALGKERQKRGVLINGSVSFKGKTDGVADISTQEELKYWSRMEYCKPNSTPKYRFPLDKKHRNKGYHSGARAFGSSRGARAHAGCDLYAPAGEPIYAIEDGTITNYYDYYWQTFALVINHNGTLVLYGEVQPPKNGHGYTGTDIPPENLRSGLANNLAVRSSVKKGQHIAYVGQLRQLDKKTNKRVNYKDTMLHFEMYKGNATGGLTQPSNKTFDNVPIKNYMRRKDLLNPKEYIDNMSDE